MPKNLNDFLNDYSLKPAESKAEACRTLLDSLYLRERLNALVTGNPVGERKEYWKYGERGILEKVTPAESNMETMMENMLRGTVYVLPAFDGEGKPDFDRMKTLTAEEHQGRFYVQVMDAENAREAYEEKPVNAPDFIDRLVDFFCRLVGKRDTVCALWDAPTTLRNSSSTRKRMSSAGKW